MTPERMKALRDFLFSLKAQEDVTSSETIDVFRIDGLHAIDRKQLEELQGYKTLGHSTGVLEVQLFGEISGEIDLATPALKEISSESLSLRITKLRPENAVYFFSSEGFSEALRNIDFRASPLVMIVDDFQIFKSATTSFCPWNMPVQHSASSISLDSPRRLVRDQTHEFTPDELGPWYLMEGEHPSEPFRIWRKRSIRALSFSIPSEIRNIDHVPSVVLRGQRSTFVAIDDISDDGISALYPVILEAIRWIYEQPRDTETKFVLLNNHLALDWRDGTSWPAGLCEVLENSLSSAREAFAFHLQDQSKEATKSLTDLRKGLQEEVSKAQQSTRDLLAALWRDGAIAGAVFALRTGSLVGDQLKNVALAAITLLIASIVVSLGSNWRHDVLTRSVRQQWRKRLYAFMSDDQWDELVEVPLQKVRVVYRLSATFVSVVYLALILGLIWVVDPSFLENLVTSTARLSLSVLQVIRGHLTVC
ncbi:hypothetical protein [Rhizobium leguminosarum]|uniref:hypothetical protein n=1 Tax=Rhizobium leguminosarum TaxID=384 RepID=UPI000377BA13|nr:hypothetical protein [Rhizobium leguminosarum]AVC49095.1 hypothetical protein RLV_3933 [Rhizobium leguminosarum bv. viciae]NKK41069.1 hypothetical protein [Rhizobium leguminosarum bv. viciae]